MKEKKFFISGMSCHHCVMAIERELRPLALEKFDVKIGMVDVKYDESKLSEEMIISAIKEAGYKVV